MANVPHYELMVGTELGAKNIMCQPVREVANGVDECLKCAKTAKVFISRCYQIIHFFTFFLSFLTRES